MKYFKNILGFLKQNKIVPANNCNKVIPLCCCSQMYFYGYCKCNK